MPRRKAICHNCKVARGEVASDLREQEADSSRRTVRLKKNRRIIDAMTHGNLMENLRKSVVCHFVGRIIFRKVSEIFGTPPLLILICFSMIVLRELTAGHSQTPPITLGRADYNTEIYY